MKHVMNARRSLKTKSVFNLLGPLTNPLAATVQLVGVFDAGRTEMMAETLRAVRTERAYVVAGSDGIDEITTTGPTRLSSSTGNGVETRNVQPEDFGLPRASIEQLQAVTSRPMRECWWAFWTASAAPIVMWFWRIRGSLRPGGQGARFCRRR